nr:MAG TPA: hypothetical protein [Caudoviricetes sp.]
MDKEGRSPLVLRGFPFFGDFLNPGAAGWP